MTDAKHSSGRASWRLSSIIIPDVASSFFHILLKQSFEKQNNYCCYSP
jgi:hypothetical protein